MELLEISNLIVNNSFFTMNIGLVIRLIDPINTTIENSIFFNNNNIALVAYRA